MIYLSPLEASKLLAVRRGKNNGKKVTSSGCVPAESAQILSDYPPHITEYRFHQSRKWRFDAAWPDVKFAVEFHGGIHVGGRHTRGVGFIRDREKMNEAALLGWTVIEVTPEHIKSGQLRQWLDRIFEHKKGVAA